MAFASCRFAALIHGLIAANLLWLATSELAAEENSGASFSFVSDEATAPIAAKRLSSRTTMPSRTAVSNKLMSGNPMRGRSTSFRTDTTMTVVNNQNTSRQTIFGSKSNSLNPNSRQSASDAPKQRKGLFSSWGGGSKLGFFKKGDTQPSVDARTNSSSLSIANTQAIANAQVPSPNRSSRTTIKDSSVLPAVYNNSPQRGGQLQLRSNGGNRPGLFGKSSKRSQPKPQRPQAKRSLNQRSQNQYIQQQAPQKQASKPDAATAALELRRNSTKSVPNPLDNMFQRRGQKNSGRKNSGRNNSGQANASQSTPQSNSSQQLSRQQLSQRRGQNRSQYSNDANNQIASRPLTKRTATRKPTTPSPVARKPADSARISSQLKAPVNLRQQRSLRASRTKVSNQGPLRPQPTSPLLTPTPLSRAPQIIQSPLENIQPIAKPAPAPLTSAQQHVSKLIVEIHAKAQTAKTADEYTFILASCRRALAVEPKGELADYSKTLAAWALNRRGQLRADTGDDQHAMLDFEDALKLDSNQWRALHNRAVLRAQTGDFEQAFDDFNRCTELNPRFAKAYSNRGALFVQAGDLLAALQDYRRAIQLDPDLAVAHKGRGRVCHMLGSLDESLHHFDAAMLLAPNDAHVVASRADLLADTGRYSDAASEYKRAVQMDKTLAHALRSAAWLLATCPEDDVRDSTAAMDFALKAIDLDRRENIISLDTLAAAQANSGDFAAAVATMDRVLAMAPVKERSTYKHRLELYTDSKPFRIQPVEAVQPASYTQ